MKPPPAGAGPEQGHSTDSVHAATAQEALPREPGTCAHPGTLPLTPQVAQLMFKTRFTLE